MKPVLGLTMGDPAGIGPELCLRALREPGVLAQCVPVVFGDADVLRRVAKGGLIEPECATLSLAQWEKQEPVSGPTIVDCAAIHADEVVPGKISAACGRAGYVYIENSIRAALGKKIAGVVTAPIHKEALHLAKIPHPGHTEIFTALTNSKRGCMMLRSEALTVSMVTTHIGYTDVPERISTGRILDVIELTDEAMRCILGRQPRLAVCGLNPHAGEHGLFGRHEEERFIMPAVKAAREKNIKAEGPLPPDTAFTALQRKHFDAFVTMYHDQGHIPFKMLAFETGVNITLGLPIIRTSVDHGTALDIAWKCSADPQSMFAAIRVAVELTGARQQGGAPA